MAEPLGPISYSSHVEPGACVLQLSREKAPQASFLAGGKGSLRGADATWERTAGALVACVEYAEGRGCLVCTPDPKTLPRTASSPAAGCTGTPGSCSSRSMTDCWHGCDASFGTSYSTSDDRCDGTSDPCEALKKEDLCESIPGCDWR